MAEQAKLLKELRDVATNLSVDVLRAGVRSDDINATGYAVEGLERVGSDDAVEGLIECLGLPATPRLTLALVALRRLKAAAAVSPIIDCLTTRDTELRSGQIRLSILALGSIPHARSLPALAPFLIDKRRRIRRAAAWSVAQIRSPDSATMLREAAGRLPVWKRRPISLALKARAADEA